MQNVSQFITPKKDYETALEAALITNTLQMINRAIPQYMTMNK